MATTICSCPDLTTLSAQQDLCPLLTLSAPSVRDVLRLSLLFAIPNLFAVHCPDSSARTGLVKLSLMVLRKHVDQPDTSVPPTKFEIESEPLCFCAFLCSFLHHLLCNTLSSFPAISTRSVVCACTYPWQVSIPVQIARCFQSYVLHCVSLLLHVPCIVLCVFLCMRWCTHQTGPVCYLPEKPLQLCREYKVLLGLCRLL